MTTDIKKSGPPTVPPRHASQYYEDEPKKMAMPPITPKRYSSRIYGNYDKETALEKNSSANTLLDSKEYDSNILENEIMNDLNHLTDHFKVSEDKLTLYEEENDDRRIESLSEASALKSLSSLTINDENNVRENRVQDIPSSDDDSFKSIPERTPVSLENRKMVHESPRIQQVQQPEQQPVQQVHPEQQIQHQRVHSVDIPQQEEPQQIPQQKLQKVQHIPQQKVHRQKVQQIPQQTVQQQKVQPVQSSPLQQKVQPVQSSPLQQKVQPVQPSPLQQKVQPVQPSPLQQEIVVKEHHKKEKSSKSKSSSKSKEERRKQKLEKRKHREEKRRSRRMSKQQIPSPVNSVVEQELESLKEKEMYQRQYILKEQEKLSELNQKQYMLLQHQYNLAINQKKQYSILMQNNDLDQLQHLQQQHERENASLQQNQDILEQQVVAQQQTITDAIDVHNNIVKKLIGYTGESPEIYAIPTPQQTPQQIPPQTETSIHSNNNSVQSSPSLSNRNSISPEIGSPSPMSPVVNNVYYDEGVYSVSGFSVASGYSVASGNTSLSEDVESVSVLTDQLQQSVIRRPTFQKPGSISQKVRFGGADPDTFQTTLNAYRLNALNATDPALQFEYAKFLIEAANDQYENSSSASNMQNKNDLFDEGFKFLKKLSNAGYPDAQYYLASNYNEDGEWDKAYPLYVQAAKHNHPVASYEIATYYESKRNYKKASQYYKKAASQGYPMAMYRLGCAALRGEMHMRKDVKNAIKWLKRAANVATKDNNAAAAAYELSELYENGMPPQIYPDELYALELLVQAAELDYPPAQYKLGWCFEYGELGCPTDAVQSIHWFLLAAENGEPNAQFSLAGWYLTGAEGVIEPNDKEAFYWAMKAAQQEYDKAEYAVAYFYEMGIGIGKNMKEAMRWYNVAAEHGDERAIKRLGNDVGIHRGKSSNNECKIA